MNTEFAVKQLKAWGIEHSSVTLEYESSSLITWCYSTPCWSHEERGVVLKEVARKAQQAQKNVAYLSDLLRHAGEGPAAKWLEGRTEEQWAECENKTFNRLLIRSNFSFSTNLLYAFRWDLSPEGYDFWNKIFLGEEEVPVAEKTMTGSNKADANESDTAEPEFNEYPTGVIRSGGDKPRPDMISPFIMQEAIRVTKFDEYPSLWGHLLDFQITGDRVFLSNIFEDVIDAQGVGILMDVGQRMYEGARKHDRTKDGVFESGDRNWEKGTPVSRAFAGAYRHLIQLTNGEDDENHLTAFLCNVFFMHHTLEMIDRGLFSAELDDLPHYMPPDNSPTDFYAGPLGIAYTPPDSPTDSPTRLTIDSPESFGNLARAIEKRVKQLEEAGEKKAADALRGVVHCCLEKGHKQVYKRTRIGIVVSGLVDDCFRLVGNT